MVCYNITFIFAVTAHLSNDLQLNNIRKMKKQVTEILWNPQDLKLSKYKGDLIQLIKELHKKRKIGATHYSIDIDIQFSSVEGIEMSFIKVREETDEEHSKRMECERKKFDKQTAEQAKIAERNRMEEIETLKQLRAKYPMI